MIVWIDEVSGLRQDGTCVVEWVVRDIVKDCGAFEMSRTAQHTQWYTCCIPQDWNLQRHCCENPKSCDKLSHFQNMVCIKDECGGQPEINIIK